MSDSDFTPYESLLNEGDVPVVGYRLLACIDADGDDCFRVACDYIGAPPLLSSSLGFLELAKQYLSVDLTRQIVEDD